MKKTLTINLNRQVFNIDEDAYALLDNYLQNLKIYFAKEQDSNEILADFEVRIGELFDAKIAQKYDVISIEDVENVIAQMGRPQDFSENADTENPSQSFGTDEEKARKENDLPPRRKLFRDTQQKLIGGVCAGLAAFFKIDTVWVRLGIVFVFFCTVPIIDWILIPGWLIIAYIAMWLIVPAAKTAEDRLTMTGKKVTVENIGKTVSAQQTVNQSNNSGCAGTFLKICLLALAAFVLVPAMFALGVLLFVFVAILFGLNTGLFGVLLPSGLVNMAHPEIATLGVCLLVGIPIFVLIYSILSAILKWKPVKKWIKISGLAVWILSISSLFFAGWQVNWKGLFNEKNWKNWENSTFTVSVTGKPTRHYETLSFALNTLDIREYMNIELRIDSVTGKKASSIEIECDDDIFNHLIIEQNSWDNRVVLRPSANFHLMGKINIVIQSNDLQKINVHRSSFLQILPPHPKNLEINSGGTENVVFEK